MPVEILIFEQAEAGRKLGRHGIHFGEAPLPIGSDHPSQQSAFIAPHDRSMGRLEQRIGQDHQVEDGTYPEAPHPPTPSGKFLPKIDLEHADSNEI